MHKGFSWSPAEAQGQVRGSGAALVRSRPGRDVGPDHRADQRQGAQAVPDSVASGRLSRPETGRHYKFLTNNFSLAPKTIADIYKARCRSSSSSSGSSRTCASRALSAPRAMLS